MRIWIIDDDPTARQVARQVVEKMEGDVREFESADGVVEGIEAEQPDLLLVDVMMPGQSGTDLCIEIRRISSVPIIFVSSQNDTFDRVVGLEIGADDYVSKPFHPRELEARIKAVLRRQHHVQDSEPMEYLEVGKLALDEVSFKVFVDGEPLELTQLEFSFLRTLMNQPRRVFSREALMAGAYDGVRVSRKTIDSHIRRLRSNFAAFGIDPVRTVRGVGYALNLDELEAH